MKKATESWILWPLISLGITKTDQRTLTLTSNEPYYNKILSVFTSSHDWPEIVQARFEDPFQLLAQLVSLPETTGKGMSSLFRFCRDCQRNRRGGSLRLKNVVQLNALDTLHQFMLCCSTF
jgi:hypothetical protein